MMELLFYVAATIALLATGLALTRANAAHALIYLIVSLLAVAVVFFLVGEPFAAALEIVIYAGAIMVLFVFVIMMIGPATPEPPVMRGMLVKTVSVAVMMLLTALLAFSLMPVQRPLLALAACSDAEGPECDQFGGVLAFSKSLFAGAVVPFELVSVLLTVAIIGAIAVARGRTEAESAALAKKLKSQEQARLAQEARERTLAAEVSAHGGH